MSSSHVCIALRFNEPVLRAELPAFADDDTPYNQIIKGILNDTHFAFHLPAKVQAIALLSYSRGFLFEPSRSVNDSLWGTGLRSSSLGLLIVVFLPEQCIE